MRALAERAPTQAASRPGLVRQRHRAVFVSDVHLGTRGTQAARFLEFLRGVSCEHLYLIGDIIDFSGLSRRWHWEQSHSDVLEEVLAVRARGTNVTYIPGNHDWFVRGYQDLDIGGVRVTRRAIHETVDGRRFLLVHGDEFDRSGPLATFVGDALVGMVQSVSRLTNGVRRAAGLRYQPFGSRLRHSLQHLVPHVARFERAAAAEARRSSLHGVICGHIHISAMKPVDGVLYCNTGDWVDSCTAVREDHAGRLSLIDCAETRGRVVLSEIRRIAAAATAQPLAS